MSLDVFGRYPSTSTAPGRQFTVAKDQNVRLKSGWFSERDVCYLASGKPVISQDTGFSNILPTGDGLFAFTSADGALAAIDRINSDYRNQCDAARASPTTTSTPARSPAECCPTWACRFPLCGA